MTHTPQPVSIPGKLRIQLFPAVILLMLDIVYLGLLALTFIANIDLAESREMQFALHFIAILCVVVYFFFVETVYRTEDDKSDGRIALIFAALFMIPVLLGRGIALNIIAQDSREGVLALFNLYSGGVSVSRTVELVGWTTLFPLSTVFLAKVFFTHKTKTGKALAWACLLSAICCFIAFMFHISSSMLYIMIGILGWGALFLAILVLYIAERVMVTRAQDESRH